MPAGSNGLHHDGQGRIQGSGDQVVGQFVGVVEAATDHEEVTTVHRASAHDRQASPVKEALAFGAQAGREALPIAGTQRLLRDTGDITEQKTCSALHANDFGARDGQRVGVALLFEEDAQVRAMAVNGISHDPAEKQASSGLVRKRTRSGIWAACLRGRSEHQSSGRYNSREIRAWESAVT